MKHIKRKFLFHEYLQQNDFQNSSLMKIDVNQVDQNFLKKNAKDNFAILTTDTGEKLFSFIYNDNGKHCMIPVPDFSLVNYNFAYTLNIERKEHRKKLVQNLAELTTPNEVSNTYAYNNKSLCRHR